MLLAATARWQHGEGTPLSDYLILSADFSSCQAPTLTPRLTCATMTMLHANHWQSEVAVNMSAQPLPPPQGLAPRAVGRGRRRCHRAHCSSRLPTEPQDDQPPRSLRLATPLHAAADDSTPRQPPPTPSTVHARTWGAIFSRSRCAMTPFVGPLLWIHLPGATAEGRQPDQRQLRPAVQSVECRQGRRADRLDADQEQCGGEQRLLHHP